MGWETHGERRYFYTSRRVGDRVVKTYIGHSDLAKEFAALQAEERAEKSKRAAELRAERDKIDALAELLDPLDELADVLVNAALVAAGFHRPHRGHWRKKRHD